MRLACLFFLGSTLLAQCIHLPATTALGTIHGRSAIGDSVSGDLLSWTSPYQCNAAFLVVDANVDFWLNHMPDDGTGNPLYYRYPQVPLPAAIPGSPAVIPVSGQAALFIEAALNWKAITGRTDMLAGAITYAHFLVNNGTSPNSGSWPAVAFSSSGPATIPYNGLSFGTPGVIEPDKLAHFGYQLVKLFEATADAQWLTLATHYADVLTDQRVTSTDASHSPWPFRVLAATGAPVTANDTYTASMFEALLLFDELIQINQHGAHSIADYTAARNATLTWFLAFPVTTNFWDNCCEDIQGVLPNTNITTSGIMGAVYLLNSIARDPSYLAKAQSIITFMENRFAAAQLGNAEGIREQDFFPEVTVSATLHFARACAMLARLTTGPASTAYRNKALRSMNFSTYMLSLLAGATRGQAFTGPAINDQYLIAAELVPIVDYVYIMQLFPEWGQTQLVLSAPSNLSGNLTIQGAATVK